MKKITVRTGGKEEVRDLTEQIAAIIEEAGFKEGVCHVFCAHTTAAIATADLDPGADRDMLEAFRAMMPDISFRHPHNPAHMPDHILATMLGASALIPVAGGRLQLGTWQRVVLFEFDGPRPRDVIVTLLA